MAFELERVIGQPVLAGAKVNRRGFAAGIGSATTTPATGTPEFGRVGYLALTEDELILFKLDSGSGRARLGALLHRVPRELVTGARFDYSAAHASDVTIAFADGERWMLEAPRPNYRDAEALVEWLATESPATSQRRGTGPPGPLQPASG